MTEQPTLTTNRLMLRPFTLADAPDVQRLAGERDVAATTLNIRHPYEDGMAEEWIDSHAEAFAQGGHVTFAITDRRSGELLGAIGLVLQTEHDRAELGYWIGKPHWGRGYASEAAAALVRYGFEVVGLNRIHACHFADNAASGRVLRKIGMRREGCLRRHVKKWDRFVDLNCYAILRDEFAST